MSTPQNNLFNTDYDVYCTFSDSISTCRNTSRNYRYMYYDISNLSKLLSIAKGERLWSDEDEPYMIRFVVRNNRRVLFGLEGSPSLKVPGHKNIGDGRVLSAGNVYFNQEGTQITGFSNKSGDYRPAFDSLVWLYALFQQHDLLKAQGITFSNTLTFRCLDKSSGAELATRELPIKDFIKSCTSLLSELEYDLICAANQPMEVIIDEVILKKRSLRAPLSALLTFSFDAHSENDGDLGKKMKFSALSFADDAQDGDVEPSGFSFADDKPDEDVEPTGSLFSRR